MKKGTTESLAACDIPKGRSRRSCWVWILVVIASGSIVAAAWLNNRNGDAAKWSACIGKPLSRCKPVAGYDPIDLPCLDFLDCSTTPPSAVYASSRKIGVHGFWRHYEYVVLGMDRQGYVRRVEIKSFYLSL